MNSFRYLHQPTNRIIHVDQKEYLFFGGTAYLGLLVNEEYQSLFKEGINIYGLNNGTSRSNNVQLGIYDQAEEKLASRFGFEDAALFSSGYLAAQAVVKILAAKGDVHYAPNSHPALWIGEKPEVLADDFQIWLERVVLNINTSANKNFVLIANAIDNLKPELYDFSYLRNIDSRKNVLLILDDSHGLGVVRKNETSAVISALDVAKNIEIVLLASLAKGLGTDAGVVLSSKALINEVKKSPIFMGASPSSPAFIYALLKGEHIYEDAFARLQENISLFQQNIKDDIGLNAVDHFPVFSSMDPNLYRYLSHNDVLISSFPYPLPTSPLLNRVVISALHTPEDLLKLTELLYYR